MSRFPYNKNFAFSIFDDTDSSTVESIQPVYRLLRDLGFRTTKSVWPLAAAPGARFGGSTLQDADYLKWIRQLHGVAFEIGLHNVRSGSAPREIIVRGLEEFCSRIGEYPRAHANHSDESNQDGLAAESGICIMYTHFASGFCRDGEVDPRFERLMRRLSKLNGWFVPVSKLLEFLLAGKSQRNIPVSELAKMEKRWIRYKMRVGRG